MTKNERIVAKFCKEVLAIVKGGEKPIWFSESVGLCSNFYNSPHCRDTPFKKLVWFKEEYPFGDYWSNGERQNKTIYRNPARLAFLEEWAKKLDKPAKKK